MEPMYECLDCNEMSDTHWVVLMNFTDIAYGTYLGAVE